jgi:hypothetical protein
MRSAWQYLAESVKTHPFNFLTLVLALASAVFAGWSAFEAHQTRIDTDKAAEAQAADVESSAKAAQRSADASEQLAGGVKAIAHDSKKEFSLNKQRFENAETTMAAISGAFISVETAAFPQDFVDHGQTPRFLLTLSNSGKIPAQGFTLSVARKLTARAEAFIPKYDTVRKSPAARVDRTEPLGTHETVKLPLKNLMSLSKDDFDQLAARKKILYIYGVVMYQDRLNPDQERDFCQHYSQISKTFVDCAKGNVSVH